MPTKIIVILGTTASGKSNLAVDIAKKFDGEVISADSRQVYRGLDLGSGKITKKEMGGIPHYMLDIASPKRRYTVARYKKEASEAIIKIIKKGRTPIIAGGTAFYIYALIDGLSIPAIPPESKLRKKLEKKSIAELLALLARKDPRRAREIEQKNKRRLIRALEIVLATGKPVPLLAPQKSPYQVLWLGITYPKAKLAARIEKRLLKRLAQGMVGEVSRLHKEGLSWKRLFELGLEYRAIAEYLQKKISKDEMRIKLQRDIANFAKRQMTWFKKDKRIKWVKNAKDAEKFTRKFLRN